MTVDELIVELKRLKKKHPEVASKEVSTEGCDCWGNVAKVELRAGDVLLARS